MCIGCLGVSLYVSAEPQISTVLLPRADKTTRSDKVVAVIALKLSIAMQQTLLTQDSCNLQGKYKRS